jgi:SAM-dependent methyltransferase
VTTPFTDRSRLVNDAYADASKLAARQDIYRFRAPGPDFHDRLLELVDWSGMSRVLDIGCGNAVYLRRLLDRLPAFATVAGIDLSVGMLASANHPGGRIVADAQDLPVGNDTVDAILALHMLYHLPQPRRAVEEFRRVLSDGGVAIISTNGPDHLAELIALGDNRVTRGSRVLGLDAAAELVGTIFHSVNRYEFTDHLVISEPEPLISYVRSTISLGGDPVAVARTEQRIREHVATGPFRVTVQPGALICR